LATSRTTEFIEFLKQAHNLKLSFSTNDKILIPASDDPPRTSSSLFREECYVFLSSAVVWLINSEGYGVTEIIEIFPLIIPAL
jgi:hypothetical protein